MRKVIAITMAVAALAACKAGGEEISTSSTTIPPAGSTSASATDMPTTAATHTTAKASVAGKPGTTATGTAKVQGLVPPKTTVRIADGVTATVTAPTTAPRSPDVSIEPPGGMPASPPTKQATIQSAVHPGAFCSTPGAIGRTTTGDLLTCKTSATDTRNRWRA